MNEIDIQNAINAVSALKTTFQAPIDAAELVIGILQNTITVTTASLETTYRSQIDTLTADGVQKSNEIDSLQSTNGQLTSDKIALQSEVDNLTAQVATLTQAGTDKDAQIATLTSDLATANATITSLQNPTV
jgi:peptidoglycan hydrolase CwlO-like protein